MVSLSKRVCTAGSFNVRGLGYLFASAHSLALKYAFAQPMQNSGPGQLQHGNA